MNRVRWKERPKWDLIQSRKRYDPCLDILSHFSLIQGFPGGISGKESTCQCRRHKRWGFNTWVRKIPWRREWQPTPVFLPGESHEQRNLTGYSPWGHKELGTTKQACMQTGQMRFPFSYPLLVLPASPSLCLLAQNRKFQMKKEREDWHEVALTSSLRPSVNHLLCPWFIL